MDRWIAEYVRSQKAALDSIPLERVAELVRLLRSAWQEDRQLFVFGNGGSAANASHFATDLGKSASDRLEKPFRVLSLSDNVSLLTAIANDYAYEDIFLRQLRTLARPGDVAIAVSVSGDSPNCVKAVEWATAHGMHTVALVGARRGRLVDVATTAIVIEDTHYGRVEDAQMTILHMACYAFVENPDWVKPAYR